MTKEFLRTYLSCCRDGTVHGCFTVISYTGIQGPTGPQGVTGPRGNTGATGATGSTGAVTYGKRKKDRNIGVFGYKLKK